MFQLQLPFASSLHSVPRWPRVVFVRNDTNCKRVQFVLDPLYKIFSCVIGEETKSIEKMLAHFKIKLKGSTYGKDIKPLLTDVCTAVFGQASGLTEMLATHIPSSKRAAQSKVEHLYLGPPVRACMHGRWFALFLFSAALRLRVAAALSGAALSAV